MYGVYYLAAAAAEPDHASFLGSEFFWVIVAAVASVVAIAVTITLYMLSRARRAVAYEVATTPLLSDRAPGELKITYEGVPVQDATLVEIDVRNVGNVPIRRDDFESQLVGRFAPGVLVVQAEVTATQPVDLSPSVTSGAGGVAVDPLLLNPGDGFTLQILASDFNGDVELHGRIAGVSEFQRSYVTPQERLLRSTELAAGLALASPLFPGLGAATRVSQALVSFWMARRER